MTKENHRIHRVTYNSNFTITPNKIMEHEFLSWGAKSLLMYMISRPENWKIYRNHLSKIYKGDKRGNGEYAVDGWFDELIEFGFIVYTKNDPKTGKYIHRYDVYPEAQDELKNKLPKVVKPPMDLPSCGLTALYNKKVTQTRKDSLKDTYRKTAKKPPKPKDFKENTVSFSKNKIYVLKMAEKFGLKDSQLDTVAFLCNVDGLGTKPETICWWAKNHSFERIQEVVRYAKTKNVASLGAYIKSLLQSGAIINEANVLENTELAKFYRDIMNNNLEIMKAYVKIPHPNGFVEEIPLTLDVKTFSEKMSIKFGDLYG